LYLNFLPEDTKERIVTAKMSDKEQCIDPNKTAHDVFKMVYDVPIQGTNYFKKDVKTSREIRPNINSQEEWPKLSAVITKRYKNHDKTYAMRVSKN